MSLYADAYENGEVLNMTVDHPMLTENGWRTVENETEEYVLKVGDSAICISGPTKVVNITVYSCAPTPTYCLMVRDYGEETDNDADDNFIANGIVAHNRNSLSEFGNNPLIHDTPELHDEPFGDIPLDPANPVNPPQPPQPYQWQE